MKHVEKAEESKACGNDNDNIFRGSYSPSSNQIDFWNDSLPVEPHKPARLELGRENEYVDEKSREDHNDLGLGGIFRQPCQEETIFSVHPAASEA